MSGGRTRATSLKGVKRRLSFKEAEKVVEETAAAWIVINKAFCPKCNFKLVRAPYAMRQYFARFIKHLYNHMPPEYAVRQCPEPTCRYGTHSRETLKQHCLKKHERWSCADAFCSYSMTNNQKYLELFRKACRAMDRAKLDVDQQLILGTNALTVDAMSERRRTTTNVSAIGDAPSSVAKSGLASSGYNKPP